MNTFARDGLRLHYPTDWRVDDEPAEGGWTATFQSPGTAFLVLRMDASLPTCEDVLDATLEALRAEYKDVDVEPALETMAGEMAVGYDVEFSSLDVPTACWARSFYGPGGTVLLFAQVADVDAEAYEPALRAISESLRAED